MCRLYTSCMKARRESINVTKHRTFPNREESSRQQPDFDPYSVTSHSSRRLRCIWRSISDPPQSVRDRYLKTQCHLASNSSNALRRPRVSNADLCLGDSVNKSTPVSPPSTALPLLRTFTSTSSPHASTVTQRKRHQDPYALAQARARKAANLSRQEVLKKERAAALGDPVKGVPTAYLRSFDTVDESASAHRNPESATEGEEATAPVKLKPKREHFNHFLTPGELRRGIEYSKHLTTPTTPIDLDPSLDPAYFMTSLTAQERAANLAVEQENAAEALRRIASLNLGSSKDLHRANVQRCIADFGRHNTDRKLPPKPAAAMKPGAQLAEKTPRVGPDTGSSEVQIAILTAKIRTLTTFLETRGNMDKHNKRNLRLLVHRRAKLLKYLRQKERAGPRWKNLVEKLGLVEGTWKGEIRIMGPLGGHSEMRLQKLLRKEEA